MRKRVIVDIDNTLWDFGSILWEYLKAINVHTPDPSAWHEWDFWEDYVTEKEFYIAIHSIHLNQNHHKFKPYPESKSFLDSLMKDGYYLLIASHRDEDTRDSTIKMAQDSWTRFRWGIVDDSPILLDKAKHLGIVRTGLMHPWNTESGHPLFDNLNKVYEHLKKRMQDNNCFHGGIYGYKQDHW
jgi:hypothetical protein